MYVRDENTRLPFIPHPIDQQRRFSNVADSGTATSSEFEMIITLIAQEICSLNQISTFTSSE